MTNARTGYSFPLNRMFARGYQSTLPSQTAQTTVSAGLLRALQLMLLLSGCYFPCSPIGAQQTPNIRVIDDPEADATDYSVQLRIAWGGGPEQFWQGEISYDRGPVRLVRALGIEADEPGTMYVEQDKLLLRSRSSRAYDGVDLRVPYEKGARLTVRLAAGNGKAFEESFPLEELLHQSRQRPLDDRGNRLFVRRLPGDQLRIVTARPHLVFVPRETWNWELTPHLLPLNDGVAAKIKARLTAKNGGEVWTGEYQLEQYTREWSRPAGGAARQPSIPFQTPLPEAEGVYELTVEAIERGPLRWGKTVLSRQVQILVLADQAPRPLAGDLPWNKIHELDPTNPGWAEKLRGSWTMWPGSRPGPLTNGLTAPHSIQGLNGQVMRQSGERVKQEPAWDAYPLLVAKPGQPHLLEIEYPRHLPMALGISIVEPNAAGQVQPIGLDSGVQVPAAAAENEPGWAKHQLVFWPRGRQAFVLLTNRSGGGAAYYGKLRVLAGPAQLPPLTMNRLLPAEERLFGAAWLKPLFTKQFCAQDTVDPWSGRALDDWQTFYEGTTRLVDYCRYAGYNAAMVSVWADGSALFPSRLLQSTPRYDTGIFFDSGVDPRRKDVVEALLRIAARQGVRVTPTMQFTAPLPALERQLRESPTTTTGIELLGKQGESWRVARARRGTGAFYNPLDERVQQAILDVVDEFLTRYAGHSSLTGLALELGPDSYLHFPGEDWGLDDQTFARFAAAHPTLEMPSGAERITRRAQLIAADRAFRKAWLSWRNERLREFHDRLSAHVAQVRPGMKLHWLPTQTQESPTLQAEFQPRAAVEAESAELLGWDTPSRQPVRDGWINAVALPIPYEPARTQLDIAWRETRAAKMLSNREPATLFYHEPQRLRLPEFDAQSPFGRDRTFTMQFTTFTLSEQEQQARYAAALARGDMLALWDGGQLPPLGQESALVDWMNLYRRLPVAMFETVPSDTAPIVVRKLYQQGHTWLYLINPMPWQVTIEFELPTETVGRVTDATGQTLADQTARQRRTLAGYELFVLRAPGEFTPSKISVQFPPELARRLEAELARLRRRRALLEQPPEFPASSNPGFEAAAATDTTRGTVEITGWRPQLQGSATVTINTDKPQTGKQALSIRTADGANAVLRSEPFDSPVTGRLALSVWLRAADPATSPEIRLAVEGARGEAGYQRFAAIGGSGPKLPGEWSQYILQIDDLPSIGVPQLAIRIDVIGKGEVLIDEVRCTALAFSEAERRQLDKSLALIEFQLQNGQYGRCWSDLQGYSARYLLTHIPEQTPPPAQPPIVEQTKPAVEPARQATKPGMWDRMRDWWR